SFVSRVISIYSCCLSLIRLPPRPTPFPYTTLFRSPYCSVNFVTAHDGFTLRDLVSYNEKHNEANGEDNRDGNDNNYSWNHGVERSEEHTSELQSRENLVCRLLLEKKKTPTNQTSST